ncbi:ecoKI restriction-modification system protein HsdS [Legionella pneumophila]|uniref:restriction endonuclease subunit S n=1 Tax=Legionella pneumophila TaxID=446 RepID=UPI0005C43297|nr:restriction endonuclease subunit S [Legionella pneumophila]GAN26152.1 ecoKI restriction-modification system protein HsdS [Legionella pneumophila]
MELKEGYKKTEIGVIPTDWKCLKILDLVENDYIDKPMDGNHGNIHPKKSDFVNDGIPFIMANNIIDGLLDLKNCNYLKQKQAESLLKGFALTGDILLTHKGTVGNTAIVEKIFSPYLMLTPQVTYYRIKNSNYLDRQYLRYFFDGYAFQKILKNLSGGGTRAYIGITKQIELPMVLPATRNEQTAIGKALSDADAWIQSLTQLIAKKHQIKQGAMQALLNPYENGRLKKGWVIKSIEEMCVPGGIVRGPFGGALKKDCFVDNGYKVYEQRNAIYRNIEIGNYYIDKKKFQELKRFSIRPYDFIISCSGTIGRIYQIPRESPLGIINQALLKLTIETKFFSDKYFYHYFSWERFQDEIIESTQGGAMKNLVGMPIFKSTQIALPERLQEQEHIATVLSDIDADISELENKLNKAKKIKQGMMQNLLTGRIRLI